MLVAGIDVGNSTTEAAVARVEPGGEPRWLWVGRCPTTGPKGSAACLGGIAELLGRAERRLGARPELALLAELHPVRTGLLELGRVEELATGRTAVARPASQTPSGRGVGAGVLTALGELRGEPVREEVVVVIGQEDFELAAARLREGRDRGWRISAAIVQGDDAVLIGNRFDRSVPIVDEVADVDRLPLGCLAAVEVAEPGGSTVVLSDPLRLGILLGLDDREVRAARAAARAVSGCRAAIVVRSAAAHAAPAAASDGAVFLVGADGSERRLVDRADPPPPGRVVAIRGAGGQIDRLLDVVWRPLPSPPEDPAFSRRLARRRALAIALLCADRGGDLLAGVGELCPQGARVVASEPEAAVLGAATTPGAGPSPVVLDLGGGTVDLLGSGRTVATAGAGELVTRMCACLLDCRLELAEVAKRNRSARVETPFTLHHEDGSRTFLGEPAPPDTLARLCAVDGRRLLALPAPLAPEVWARLRRAAKREVLGFNVRRALEATRAPARGEILLLVGGCAADHEVLDLLGSELESRDVVVARGNVLGRHGPRAAVAVGLVLTFSRRGGR